MLDDSSKWRNQLQAFCNGHRYQYLVLTMLETSNHVQSAFKCEINASTGSYTLLLPQIANQIKEIASKLIKTDLSFNRYWMITVDASTTISDDL